MLPRSWLETAIISQPDFLKAAVYLAKEINEKGKAEFSSGDAKTMFGMSPRRYRTFMQLITNDKQTDKQKVIKFTPPTDEEVAQYVAEKGYHFNPAQFVPFYQSKNWKIGKEAMKDWRAACLTWEIRWKEKHGVQFYYEVEQSTTTHDIAVSRKTQRDRGLSLANQIVSQSADLHSLYDGIIPESVDR